MVSLDFDVRTLLLCLFLGNFMAAILFAAYRFGAKEKPDVFDTIFLFGKLSQSLAWLLIALRGSVSLGLSLVAGNFFLVAGQAMECFSLASLTRISRKWWWWIFGILSTLGAVACLSLIDPQGIEARLAIVSVFSVLFFAITGGVFLFIPRNASWLTFLLGILYSSSGFGIFCRILWLRGPGEYSVFSPDVFHLLWLTLLSLVMFVSNLGYILVKKDDLDRRLLEMATRDGLTGVFNRTGFGDEARRFWELARRNRTWLSLLMLDLDNFKDINDSWGHPAGDQVLKGVAEVTLESIRPYDVLGRYGGEEFMVLLPGTNLQQAESVAERVRQKVEGRFLRDEQACSCTVSIGVASCRPERGEISFEDLISFSDTALYEAKRLGRNRVAVFPEKHEPEQSWRDGIESSAVFEP